MRRFLAALLLLAAFALGHGGDTAAQNVICADRPPGDFTYACANTRFVLGNVATGLVAASAQPLAPAACSIPPNKATIPFPVIIDGGNPINLATNSLCPEFPFNGNLAAPTANNFSFFQNQPPGIAGYASIWGNRCVWSGGGNAGTLCDKTNQGNFPIFTFHAVDYRFFFTTVARADACTIAQTQAYFGNVTQAQATLAAAGVAQLDPNNPNISGGQIVNDTCWLGYVPMPTNVKSVVYDYEVGDYRTTAQALATLTTLASTVHAGGQSVIFYSNNVGAYSGSSPFWQTTTACLSSGICATGSPPTTIAPQILAAFDFSTIIGDTGGGAASQTPYGMTQYLQGQANAYGAVAPMSKIMLQAQVGSMSLGQTAAMAAFVRNNGLGGIDLFNDAAAWGVFTDAAYQQTRCLVYDNPDQCGQFPFILLPNDAVTGTLINGIAKLTGTGTVVRTATTDTDGAVGIVTGNAGGVEAGNLTTLAQIITNGPASCVFDNTAVAGDFVTISSSVAGNCHDGGATRPASEVIGRAIGAGTGTVEILVDLQLGAAVGGITFNPSGSGICGSGLVSLGGSITIGCAADNMQIHNLQLGTPGSLLGQLTFANLTSGGITLQAPTGALGSQTLTLPDVTDTIAGKALANGGTNNALTAANGGVVWSDAAKLNIATPFTGLVLATSGAMPAGYAGTSCTNQFPRSLNGSGAASCASVANTDLANSSVTYGSTTVSLGGSSTAIAGLLSLGFVNATSGSITLAAPTGALGNQTLTFPDVTDTLTANAAPQTLTNKTITSSTDVLGGVTMTLGSDAEGDIYYRHSGVLARLGVGIAGQALVVAGGLPTWGAVSGVGTVTSVTCGGGTVVITTSGTCPERILLSAPLTLYVDTGGNDSNPCTIGSKCLTINHVYGVLAAQYDFGGQTVTISLTAGQTFSAGLTVSSGWSGYGQLVLDGNNVATTVISTAGDCVAVNANITATLTVQNFKCVSSGGSGIVMRAQGIVNFTNLNFGAAAFSHVSALVPGSIITGTGTGYTISGGGNGHWQASEGGKIGVEGRTITCTGTPAFTGSFALTFVLGYIHVDGDSFPGCGGVTGQRYQATGNAVINTGSGANPTYLPGDAAGVANTGGIYQ